MKVEDVPEEWMALADTVLVPGKPLSKNDLRAALAAVIPAIQDAALERAAEEAFNEYLAAENDAETAGQSDVVARLHSEGAASAANRIMQAIRALAVSGECRPPEGTPNGTVCVLQYGSSGVDYTPIWVAGAYHWPHPTIVGTVVAYMPEELAAAGWRFHSIAEPPADG